MSGLLFALAIAAGPLACGSDDAGEGAKPSTTKTKSDAGSKDAGSKKDASSSRDDDEDESSDESDDGRDASTGSGGDACDLDPCQEGIDAFEASAPEQVRGGIEACCVDDSTCGIRIAAFSDDCLDPSDLAGSFPGGGFPGLPGGDAGVDRSDAGSGGLDAGSTRDAGTSRDAGASLDAGRDAGTSRDAGTRDAGRSSR